MQQINYFQLFDIETTFHLQHEELATKHQQLQSMFHPDRYATAGIQERRIVAQKAAFINEAYRVLTDDCARAAYLLELKGKICNLETDTVRDTDFLIEQMELREVIEAHAHQADELLAIQKKLKAKTDDLGEAFSQACNQDDLDKAHQNMTKMQFIVKLQHEIETHLYQFEDNPAG